MRATDLSRYKIIPYAGFTLLFCAKHFEDLGCELGCWNEAVEVSVEDIMKLIDEHEKGYHE